MKRIQRIKGCKLPKTAKYVGRPTKWGNPFKLSVDGYILYHKTGKLVGSAWCYWSISGGFETKDVVELYGQWLNGKLQKDYPFLPTPPSLEELKGMDLACFCPLDSPCHVDVILERMINQRILNNTPKEVETFIDKYTDSIMNKQVILNNKVYAFLYCPCVPEESWGTISLHYSKEGAEKALEIHKQKALDEFNELYADNNECGWKFGEYEDWSVKPMKILP